MYRSFSWSANVCGRKLWYLFPPGRENILRDPHGQLPFDLRTVSEERLTQAECHQLIQETGEVVFVPSCWHHQVWNLEETVSINHNWLNAASVNKTWRHLEQLLGDVQKEIADCRDMDGWDHQCQLILKAEAGMDYENFVKMLLFIGEKRLKLLEWECQVDSKNPKTISEESGNSDISDLISSVRIQSLPHYLRQYCNSTKQLEDARSVQTPEKENEKDPCKRDVWLLELDAKAILELLKRLLENDILMSVVENDTILRTQDLLRKL